MDGEGSRMAALGMEWDGDKSRRDRGELVGNRNYRDRNLKWGNKNRQVYFSLHFSCTLHSQAQFLFYKCKIFVHSNDFTARGDW